MFRQRFASFRKAIFLTVTFVLLSLMISSFLAIAISTSIGVAIQNSGKITVIGLEAYGGDINSGNDALTVNLGTLYLGSSKSISFYLRSISNVPTTLTFTINNWQPENLEQFMLVSWNYNGKQLAPNEEILIRIDLHAVDSTDFYYYLLTNDLTSFSFSLTIHALEI